MKFLAIAMFVALTAFAPFANAEGVKARGALGVTMTRTGTARVVRVAPNSPAFRAGLLPGDKIVAIGDEEIKNFHDVIRVVTGHKPGQKVEIIFERNGLQGDVDVVLSSEVDAFGNTTPAYVPSGDGETNPEWPAGYQRGRSESFPYQS
ncbi:MAG: PDZ domain-containing protein [Planctomycetes bacterium]|nr:PDZ domain-containing protein [Planctomycetota bacterium]